MNSDSELSAFKRVEFHSVFDQSQVWLDRPPGHLPLQNNALRRFRDSLEHATQLRSGVNPLGLCLVGPAGSGKTHLLGELRREAAAMSSNFVLSDLTDVRDFWPLLAMHFLQSIQRPMNGVGQLQRVLDVLLRQVKDPVSAQVFLERGRALPREGLLYLTNDVISSLRPIYGQDIVKRQKTFRALMYLESDDLDLSERAYSFLQGVEQIDEESRNVGLFGPNSAKSVVIDLSWFLSLTGPTVLAFDQLDPFIAQNNLAGFKEPTKPRLAEAINILSAAVAGIMDLHEVCTRTLVVLTCLESSWKVLGQRAVDSFRDRFEPIESLETFRDQSSPQELVALRLDEGYRLSNFTPPYRTWPFAPGFFHMLPPGLTPREILNRCERHRLDCVRAGKVAVLDQYDLNAPPPPPPPLASLDELFAKLSAGVDPASLLDETQEDTLGGLIARAAKLFRTELPFDPDVDIAIDNDFHETKRYESLHLRMRRIFHSEGEREEHICVRVLQKTNARSFQVRLTAAMTTSGTSEKLEGRRLVFLRNSEPPSGRVTSEMSARAKSCGAIFLPLKPEDVRTIVAVVEMWLRNDAKFETWLLQKRPLSRTDLFQELVPTWLDTVLPNVKVEVVRREAIPKVPDPLTIPEPKASKPRGIVTAPEPTSPAAVPRQGVLLGFRLEGGAVAAPVRIPVADLTKHVLIRAGSGGGKTVLIKRLIEEAALSGVSSIVIDTAKDLSMLGDRWQQPPKEWTKEDAELAERYHQEVDVQIWTPGHGGGRSLHLAPLPNLTGPFQEEYDREQVIQLAVSGLVPLAIQKKRATVETAILRKVVEWLTRQPQHGGSELERLIAALRDLPGETYQGFQNERKLAAGMADQIQAALVTDPLYRGQGEDLDPAVLFGVGCPHPRISVLSLFAMPDLSTQARFIGQLCSLLFNWIRKNPVSQNSPVRGLFVLDEAAPFLPSRTNAESKPGLMLLAKQARKYGLGLVLATQNPRDLDYNIEANCATQFFGTAQATQVVKFIRESMENRGLPGLDPGLLTRGDFFCATPSLPRPARLRVPMCLSAHPNNVQLTDDEILARSLSKSSIC